MIDDYTDHDQLLNVTADRGSNEAHLEPVRGNWANYAKDIECLAIVYYIQGLSFLDHINKPHNQAL